VGCGAKILGPFRVGDGARIAANSVVLREVPENATAVGVPARVVKIGGQKVRYADEVDQINVTDPVEKTLQSLMSRVELLESYADQQLSQVQEGED
jgi:serine O-acetyltransferase